MRRTLFVSFLPSVLLTAVVLGEEPRICMVQRPDATAGNEFYVGNRPPLLASPLMKLPPGAIEPRGWLRSQLELMADGVTGRLAEYDSWLRQEGHAWLSSTGDGHSYWEDMPYWLKGFGDLGYVLGDERIIGEARCWIAAVVAHQCEDGYFGPRENRSPADKTYGRTPDKPDLWPNMIMLHALRSYYEYSDDRRVLDLMTRYFRWQTTIPEDDFLRPFWQHQRAADNLDSIYWLYNRTGEEWLLDLAARNHRRTADWTEGIASWHGVNIAQCSRGPAMFYVQSKDREHLGATIRNYKTVMDLYGQMPGGMFAADENCRPGYSGPRQAAEACTMVEIMHSHEIMLKITGDTIWADRCEEVALNSFPASMTPDLKAVHYLTAPNLVLADRFNKSPGLQNSGAMLLFTPEVFRCCRHNVSHGWPYYAEHLWLAAAGNGLTAVLYAPCQVTAKVGDGTRVTVVETTDYPFDDAITLCVRTPNAVRFPLYLRVPGWCDRPSLTINGQEVPIESRPGRYLLLDRTWDQGDTVRLKLPMPITVTRWTKNKNSVSVRRGPLVYSLRIGEKYIRAGGTDQWPAWEIHPTTPWNYGLVFDQSAPASSVEVVKPSGPIADQPFEAQKAPVLLRTKGKRIPAWQQDHLGLVGPLQQSPAKSDEPTEQITLIPMGCARLRISAFPVIGEGPDAHVWKAPPPARHIASHCYPSDTVTALSDGVLPRDSGDRSIPRFTWWPRRGTTQWVTFRFLKPLTIVEMEVYWYDDRSHGGHCRVPASWRLEWLDGDSWRSVGDVDLAGVDRDKFNRLEFDPVTTEAIQLVVELQPEFSAGILEWRVK